MRTTSRTTTSTTSTMTTANVASQIVYKCVSGSMNAIMYY